MNKGMIMEVNRNYAIALNDEGLMDKILFKQNMVVGQKIFYFEDDIVKTTTNKFHKYNNFMKSIGSIAALFLLVFTFFNTMQYDKTYAVVTLDINPSIQIEADSKQIIIKVEGVNTDGKNIDFSDIKDVSLNDGIQTIKEKLIEKNYLDTNREVLVGFAFVENTDNNNNYEKSLQETIKSTFNTEKISYFKGDKEDVDEAKKKSISLGRYEVYKRADEETKNKIDKAPVKEITSSIKDNSNVIQWEVTDEKPITAPVVTNINPEKPETSANTDTNTDLGKDKPIINAPSENTNPSVEKEGGKDINTKPKVDDVLQLEPVVPVQKEPEKNPKPSEDNNIPIEPNDGTIKNNTTSGKIEEDPNHILKEPVKTEEIIVSKEIKN